MVAGVNFAIIPYPSQMIKGEGFSNVKSITVSNKDIPSLHNIMPWLNTLPYFDKAMPTGQHNVISIVHENGPMGNYTLNIQSDLIEMSYHGVEGLRNAHSTLFQLYELNQGKFPICQIADEPRFSYRGMHLDVGRHLFPLADIKKYIDYLAFYKYNTFHWHLTEDQGWRIEIKKYPELHEVGGFRIETLIGHYSDQPHQFDGKRYGGYYSQEEAKEIVAYAAARGISVIPEIELPGHSLAALSAYPELGCEDKVYEAATKWGVFSDVFCPTEYTFEFLQGVFDEIMDIFPSPYIHIGGDECPKTAWKKSAFCQELIEQHGLKDEHGLQSYFIQRIEKYLNSKGRKIIGWDEILEGGLAPNATVMSWRGEKGGIEAANANHQVIMTPTTHCYFDYYQSDHPDEPLAIGGLLPYDKVYHYEIIPKELPADKHHFVLGGQGNIWTEYMPTFEKVEYMGLTRMAALSETVWKDKSSKDFDRFNHNLLTHINYWKSKGVNMANHLFDAKAQIKVSPGIGAFITTESAFKDVKQFVQFPGSNQFVVQKVDEVPCNKTGEYSFYHEFKGQKGRTVSIYFEPHKGNVAAIQLTHPPSEKYGGSGSQSLINGVKGYDDRYGGSEWLGFYGEDLEAELDFQETQTMTSVAIRFYKGEGQWIYLPSSIQVLGSIDGLTYETLAEDSSISSEGRIAQVQFNFDNFTGRYLKIIAKNYGVIPEGKQGGGHKAWLFVDEIIID
jgi:hexosaminidase